MYIIIKSLETRPQRASIPMEVSRWFSSRAGRFFFFFFGGGGGGGGGGGFDVTSDTVYFHMIIIANSYNTTNSLFSIDHA